MVPNSGHGISIGVALCRNMVAMGWAKDLIVVGADGTNTIVRYKEGAIAYMEK